ncbi:MAG: aminotransferase class I/II-fold pyridoxal phosphate-dependent enzyme, partial [Thermoplasmata archaeon]
MKLQLSKLVQDMIKKPSPIRRIMKMADRQSIISMGLDPEKVISFGGGWVNHEAPEELRKKYIEIATDEKKFHKSGGYAPTPGETTCREAIAYFEREIFGVKLAWNNVLIGQSSTQITHDVFITIANPGDALLLLDPTYANYYGQAVFALPSARLLVERGQIEKPVFDANLVYLNVFNPLTWRYLEDINPTIEKFKKMMDLHKPKAVLVPSTD